MIGALLLVVLLLIYLMAPLVPSAFTKRNGFACYERLSARSDQNSAGARHGDKAEQAYRRGDALEKRRKLMES